MAGKPFYGHGQNVGYLAGVLRSLQQVVIGKKASFGRTPKIQSRTRTPPLHVFLQWMFLAYLAAAFPIDFAQAHYSHAVFAFANCIMCFYGIGHFLGWQESYADLCHGFHLPSFLMRPIITLKQRLVRPSVSSRAHSWGERQYRIMGQISSERVSSADRAPRLPEIESSSLSPYEPPAFEETAAELEL